MLLVIDIQGGPSSDDAPSAIPFVPAYQGRMDRAPNLVAAARDAGIPVIFFPTTHAV